MSSTWKPIYEPTNPTIIHIVNRNEWGAMQEEYTIPIEDPILTFRYHYTDTRQCFHYKECTKVVQEIQKQHMDEGWPDIQYNFLIGGDGNVYEGAGWNNKVIDISHHLMEADGSSRLIIAYICHRDDVGEGTVPLERLGYDLMNWGVQNNKIIGGHPSTRKT